MVIETLWSESGSTTVPIELSGKTGVLKERWAEIKERDSSNIRHIEGMRRKLYGNHFDIHSEGYNRAIDDILQILQEER